ncbi:hypothetical protein GHK86_02435 [Acidimicrobiaceae bacterium USS-CC1]|uniref:Uncharacterized protein n=1 Tax=Acidiferrimicrobium australe TaxID=2664430 RepID=A0ABW9QP57_9ACTN|nr:hypothetical protein [Acidiferrimicrobium australe]
MYNAIIGAVNGVLSADRLLEGLDNDLAALFRPDGEVSIARLLRLPTLLMPEIGDTRAPQVARVGNVVSLTHSGRDIHFRFVKSITIPDLPSDRIAQAATQLGFGRHGFTRTRWTVKQADLYQVLLEAQILDLPRPTVFELPATPPDRNMIAVMMPFAAEFSPVWQTLKSAVDDGGWLCQRASDIWDNSVLVNDIVGLIARSKVVICDLSGRNANVFYEAGIAHTLGREVVLIAQSHDDVPFDLRHHRYIVYLHNSEGLNELRRSLASRLRTLMAR